MISGPTEQTAAFEALGVDPADDCRVLTIEYHVPGERQTLQYTNVRTRIRWRLQARYPNALFYVGPSFLQAIITGKPDRNIDLPVHATAALIRGILEDEGVEADFQFYGGISEQRPVREIAQAGLESRATARFLRSNGEPNTVEGFEDLGVLRLFVQSGQMDLRAYVPREILDFHNEFPDLYETLRVYMRSRQSLKKTAETLGLHPKTVKYRLSRIRSRLDIDLDDARQVTVLFTSFEIIQFVTEGIGDDHHLHPA
jgi:purine catabolism regulator